MQVQLDPRVLLFQFTLEGDPAPFSRLHMATAAGEPETGISNPQA